MISRKRIFAKRSPDDFIPKRRDAGFPKFKNAQITLYFKKPKPDDDPEIEQEEYDAEVGEADEIPVPCTITYLSDQEGLYQLLNTNHIPDAYLTNGDCF